MDSIYEFSECDEVASRLNPPTFADFDAATAWVRERMPGESYQVIDNVAWPLWRGQRTVERSPL